MAHPSRPKLDVHKLVHRFGGPLPLSRKLNKRGHDISVKAINMWIWRQSLPAGWLTVLMTIAEDEGRPLTITSYVQGGGDTEFLQ